MPITVAETSVTVVFHRSLCCFPHLPSAKSTSCQNLQLHLGSFYNAVMCYRYKNIFAYVLFITVNKNRGLLHLFFKTTWSCQRISSLPTLRTVKSRILLHKCRHRLLWNTWSLDCNTPFSAELTGHLCRVLTVYIEIGFLCFPARSM